MADGGLTIELEAGLGQRLSEAARATGQSAADLAANLIGHGLDDWAEDFARLEDYERTGEYIDAEVAMAAFRQAIADRLKSKRA